MIKTIVEMPLPSPTETHAIVYVFPLANKAVIQRGRLDGSKFVVTDLASQVIWFAERPDLSWLWTARYGFNETVISQVLMEGKL